MVTICVLAFRSMSVLLLLEESVVAIMSMETTKASIRSSNVALRMLKSWLWGISRPLEIKRCSELVSV